MVSSDSDVRIFIVQANFKIVIIAYGQSSASRVSCFVNLFLKSISWCTPLQIILLDIILIPLEVTLWHFIVIFYFLGVMKANLELFLIYLISFIDNYLERHLQSIQRPACSPTWRTPWRPPAPGTELWGAHEDTGGWASCTVLYDRWGNLWQVNTHTVSTMG